LHEFRERYKTLYGIGVVFGSQILSRFLNALSLLLVIRSLTQEEFGVVGTVQSIVVIGSGLLLQGINWGMIQEISARRASDMSDDSIITTVFKATVFLGSGMGLLTSVTAVWFPWLFGFHGELLLVVGYIGAGVVTTALANFALSVLQGRMQFEKSAALSLTQSVVLLLILGALKCSGLLKLQVALLVLVGVPLVTFGLYILNNPLSGRRSATHSEWHLIDGAKWYVAYSSMIVLASQLDIVMMARFFSFKDVGVYAVAAKLYGILALGIGSINSVLLPKVSGIADRLHLRALMIRSFRYSAPVVGLLVVTMAISAEAIVTSFAGTDYRIASTPLLLLSLSAGVSILLSPMMNILFALHQKKLIVSSGILLLVLNVLGHLIFTRSLGAIGAASTNLISYTLVNGFVSVAAFALTKGRVLSHDVRRK
jgi:O-antigen/teichoic acid export membrane protein